MEKKKLRYRVSQRNFFTRLTWILLGLSMVFTVMGNWGFWKENDKYYLYLQIILPVVSCLLYMLIINHMGEKGFFLTSVPVILGAAYLIICAAASGKPLHSILMIALCIVVTMTYIMTVFGAIRTKWLLIPVFGLPLVYRIVVEDKELFFGGNGSFELAEWLPELAILCMICAMIFIVFAMRKRDFTKDEKPIEDVLVELEENLDGAETEVDAIPAEIPAEIPEFSESQETVESIDNEVTVIEPAGEKHE